MHCSNAVRRAVLAQRLLAHHKGMPRHSDKNSSTLREDVTSWCNSGVGQMTALDPELSNAPLAMKTEFCKLNLETLRELQSRVSATGATVSSSAASNDNRIMWRHQPVCQPPSSPASSAMYFPAPCAPPVPLMPSIPQPQAGFLHGWKRHSTGKPITDRQLFWEFCFKETWRQQHLLHQRELLDAFQEQGRVIGVCHKQVLQKRER